MAGYSLDELKILIVDDSKNMRQLLRTLLISFGVKSVIEAENGEAAYAEMKRTDVDLVITDLVMRPTDGFELIEKIRNDEDSPNPYVPVIIISGYTERFRVTEARDYGANEVLAKPISAKELAHRIASVIERPRAFVNTNNYFGPDRRRTKEEDVYSGPERRRNKFAIEQLLNESSFKAPDNKVDVNQLQDMDDDNDLI